MTVIRDQEAGVTLIEMLVALSLFALVGIASFTTLDTILRVRERTDGRLEHLAQLDRALLVFGRDIVQADPGTVTLRDGSCPLWDMMAKPDASICTMQMRLAAR